MSAKKSKKKARTYKFDDIQRMANETGNPVVIYLDNIPIAMVIPEMPTKKKKA